MAQDDNYKEGVDFKWVQGNGGFKTRHFFTKAEKDAMKNPKPAAAPKAKPKVKKEPPIAKGPVVPKGGEIKVEKLKPSEATPKKPTSMVDRIMQGSGRAGTAVGNAVGGAGANFNKYIRDAINRASKPGDGGDMPNVDTMGNVTGYKKGGTMKVKEGSAKDMREDKIKAKKAGMSMTKWESSAADKKHDSGMKRGGKVNKMATGGSVRGAGCATRGKGFAGTF